MGRIVGIKRRVAWEISKDYHFFFINKQKLSIYASISILNFYSGIQKVQMQYVIRYNHSSKYVFDFLKSSSFLVFIPKVLLRIPTETRLLSFSYLVSFPSLLEFIYLELSSLFSSSFEPLLEFLLMMTPELLSWLYLLFIDFIDSSPYFLPIL